MKVLFFISVQGQGRGGHNHSLDHISRQVGNYVDAKIISIGLANSPIIRKNPFFYDHFHFNGINVYELSVKLRRFIKHYNPDVLHCFDLSSYNIAMFLFASYNYKVVLNKCGGPNPRKYPFVKNLILFSRENYKWFKSQRKYQDSNIYLVPQRVNAIIADADFHPIKKNPEDFIFVRICRIGDTYKKSIYDSINLISWLKSQHLDKIALYIIGVIENQILFNQLRSMVCEKNLNVTFVTSSALTQQASKMLYLADAVIGTGRGVMEAASLGIPLLTINADDDYPVLITREYYENVFENNFSQRNKIKNYNPKRNLEDIKALIKKGSYHKELSDFSREIFKRDFNAANAVSSYLSVYKNSANEKHITIENYFYMFKSIYRFFRIYMSKRRDR